MPERPLTATLGATFAELDDLVRRDEDAAAHAEARERLAYLLEYVQEMQGALRRLRAAAALLDAVDPGCEMAALWLQTRAELRRRMPAGFRTPGRALVAGHLDLLRLVEYTAASATTANERCRQLLEHLARRLARHCERGGQQLDGWGTGQTPEAIRAAVEEMVDRLVAAGSRADAAALCRAAGWPTLDAAPQQDA